MSVRTSFVLGAGFLAVLLLAAGDRSTALAQAKKGKKDNDANQLRQIIKKLQNELQDRNERIQQLQNQLKKAKFGPDPDDAKIRNLQKQLREKEDRIDKLTADLKKAQKGTGKPAKGMEAKELADLRAKVKNLEALKQAGYVHTMILKLKQDTPEKEVAGFLDKASSALTKFPGVRGVWMGKPASVASEGAQKDYQVGVLLLFDDADALRTFLDDPAQKRWAASLQKTWESPTIFDFAR